MSLKVLINRRFSMEGGDRSDELRRSKHDLMSRSLMQALLLESLNKISKN